MDTILTLSEGVCNFRKPLGAANTMVPKDGPFFILVYSIQASQAGPAPQCEVTRDLNPTELRA